MRTTIRLDEQLLRDLKKHAAAHGRTLTSVIEDAVRELLARAARGESHQKVSSYRPLTFKGGLRPGVDLDDSAALLELMEATTAPRRR